MLTRKQISVIHIAKKELGLDDDMYQAILYHFDEVTSSKELSYHGFVKVMDYFTKCGFRSSWTKRTYGNRDGMATPPQVDYIRKMWREYSGESDDIGLNRWLQRSFKVSALRFVDDRVVKKVVTALKAMTERENSPKASNGP